MRIGYEAKKIAGSFTGIGNYARGLVNALVRYYPDDEYHLFYPGEVSEEAFRRIDAPERLGWHSSGASNPLVRQWWRSRGVVKDLRRCGVELYHGVSNEIPSGLAAAGIRSVVTVHDLIFLRYPENYDFGTRISLRRKVRYACRHADRIIAISRQTQRDIEHFYGIPSDRIEVIYQGCDRIFYDESQGGRIAQMREKYGLPERYVLCVGTLERRKNQTTLVRAMRGVDKGVSLVMVSKPTPYCREVEAAAREAGVEDRVIVLHGVPNADLPAIYRGAAVFAYVSVFEGFGIPILEALVSGVPVVAATGSCLEEAGGPSSLYCDPSDADALAGCLGLVLGDNELAARMAAEGRKYAERFDPAVIAGQVHDLYRKVIG